MIQYSQICLEEKCCRRDPEPREHLTEPRPKGAVNCPKERFGVSTHKKVLVSRFDRESLSGFVNPQSYLLADGLELMTQSGSVSIEPYDEVKLVCFVRDFQQGEPRKDLRLFTTRPKLEGLWLRMYFRDGDAMDGILSNNLLLLDAFGFSVVPPDPGFQNQRIFVPRSALSRIQVLGVVGSPLRTPRKPKPTPKEQIELF